MSQLKLKIIADPSKFHAGMSAVTKDLNKFRSATSATSRSVNKLFAAAGLSFGLTQLTRVIKQSTKAAAEDITAKNQLALALRNTLGATKATTDAAEKYVQSTSNSVAVLDDELRPALATAVRATGSLASGQKLLKTALNVSAGTGKKLDVVTNALSKAFNGQTGSLKKLLPSIKDGTNFMSQLDEQFAGAAEKAANLDPYKRLEVIFADIQETVGVALLPALEEFSAYLASPAGQQNLEQIVGLFVAMGEAITAATKFLIDNMNTVKAIIATLVVLRVGWSLSTAFVNLYTIATGKAVVATKLLKAALITTGIGAVIVGLGFLVEGWINAAEAKEEYEAVPTTPVDPNAFQGPGISPEGIPFLSLGFNSYEEYLADLNAKKDEVIRKQAAAAKAIRDALDKEVNKMKSVAEKFRDSIGLAFGTFGKDEFSVFNVDMVIEKMRRVVDAAKGFAGNLEKLRKGGADESVIDELTAMGPAQGNIVAKGLLSSGKLSTYLGLRKAIYGTGAQAGAQAVIAGDATYEININKAVISASDIIKEIQALEKKTGRRYLMATS